MPHSHFKIIFHIFFTQFPFFFSFISASSCILSAKEIFRRKHTTMITVEHLTKCYGDFTAVDDLSFEIGEGQVYGFLGPNGAGKSTTMNIMTGCLSATEGRVLIDGHDIFEEPDKAKRLIGYLPEQPPLYMNETPLEYLHFVGQAKGLKGSELKNQIELVIEKTKLTDVCHRRIAALSKGYKQRVGIAQALLGNPRVIILDEPTVGLDPIQIIEIRELIKELGKDHTVILSSHILSEVQTICEKILIIAHGKLIAYDTPDALEKSFMSDCGITLTAEADEKSMRELIGSVSGVGEITFSHDENASEEYLTAHVSTDGNDIMQVSKELFLAFAKAELPLVELTPKKATLEDVFIELTNRKEADKE